MTPKWTIRKYAVSSLGDEVALPWMLFEPGVSPPKLFHEAYWAACSTGETFNEVLACITSPKSWRETMTNQERAAEVMETHDLFHFTSGDGWMEPHEDIIRCACGEEFFSYIQTGDGSGDDDRDPNLLYRQHLAQALADAGLLIPDLPEPSEWQDDRFTGWLLNENVAVKVNQKGAVIIEHMDVGWFALPPEDANRFADMIKAAANLAEKSTNG